MRDLTKSMLRLPWAISMLGAGQVVRMLDPVSGPRKASSSLDAVSRAAEEGIDGFVRDIYRSGDHLQSGLVDTLFGLASAPPWDLSAWLRRAQKLTRGSWMALGRSRGSGVQE